MGYYIDFEAKETKQNVRFRWSLLPNPHQIQHMEQSPAHQVQICFVLHFSSQQETYLLPAYDLIRFLSSHKAKDQCLGYIREYGY